MTLDPVRESHKRAAAARASSRSVGEEARPTATKRIVLRIPIWMLDSIKETARRCDVPYQDVIKIWLGDKVLR